MSLERWLQAHYENSGTASTVARQVSFAGIAVVWVLSNSTPNEVLLPVALLWPSLFFVSALIFDFLQYFVASIVWQIFHKIKEAELGEENKDDLGHPSELTYPGYFFFYGKCCFVILGYTMLGYYIINAISIA